MTVRDYLIGQGVDPVTNTPEQFAANIRDDIERWAAKVDEAWLDQDLVWFSGAANRKVALKGQESLSDYLPRLAQYVT